MNIDQNRDQNRDLILKGFHTVTKEESCKYPVVDYFRYILYYMDSNGTKKIHTTTNNFNNVSFLVGDICYGDVTKEEYDGSMYFIDIEELSEEDGKTWFLLLTYTRHLRQRIVTFDKYWYKPGITYFIRNSAGGCNST